MIQTCPLGTRLHVIQYIEERFGIPSSVFEGYSFYAGPSGRIFLGPREAIDLSLVDTTGILIARIGKSVKPSTLFFQMYGSQVLRNGVALTREQAQNYIAGIDLELSSEAIGAATRGYVMVSYGNYALGCGLLRGNLLENVLPKEMRMTLSHL